MENIKTKIEAFKKKRQLKKTIEKEKTETVSPTPSMEALTAKPKKRFNIITALILIILISFVVVSGIYAVKLFKVSQAIGLKITPKDILEPIKKDPVLQKDSSGKYTSILLVGIDTRNVASGLKNTDSMIIATYNYETKSITMTSFPRDFYVKVPNENWYTKVNGLYAIGENKKKGDGLNYLKKALESITGIPIQYYAMIDLQGFRSVVDIMGGINVNVENTFTDYCYPAETDSKSVHFCDLINGMAETITFTKGEQKMNGAVALKYSRSRHSGDNGEGSDFYRARRQQNVLVSMRNQILSSDTLLNPKKVLSIIEALQNNLTLSEFTSEDIQAAINLGLSQKESKKGMYSFVVDPSFGNGNLVKAGGFNVGSLYVIGPKAGLDNYKDIRIMINSIQKDPGFYSENSSVRVYDSGLGYQKALQKTQELQAKYPFSNIIFMGTIFKDKTGTVIYSHTAKANTNTMSSLSAILKPDSIDKPAYVKTNLNGESVTILLGKPVTTSTDTKK